MTDPAFAPRPLLSPIIAAVLTLFLSLSVQAQRENWEWEDSAMDTLDEGIDKSAPPANTAVSPGYCITSHRINKLYFGLTNFGKFGFGSDAPGSDCFTNVRVPPTQYPQGTKTTYLFKGGLWVGGVVDRDTLVSAGNDVNTRAREFHPEEAPLGYPRFLSTLKEDDIGAVSEQDIIVSFSDTVTANIINPSFDALDSRRHRPMGLSVTQRSYGWSYDYAEDFIIVEWTIRNDGDATIHDAYVGIYMDQDCHVDRLAPFAQPIVPPRGKPETEGRDDITGFLHSMEVPDLPCLGQDVLDLAWTADNDGDVQTDLSMAVSSVLGVRFLGGLQNTLKQSFNWWVWHNNPVLEYGPQLWENYRAFGGYRGTPIGDKSKYWVMANGEVDFNQVLTGRIDDLNRTWIPIGGSAKYTISRAGDGAYCLSIGPYELEPGDVIVVPWAYVGGEHFHVDPYNWSNTLRRAYLPERYLRGVDFSEFAQNGLWAAWIYDNPGVDTDGDGNRGKARYCVRDSVLSGDVWIPTVIDTFWYEGDGFADLKGAAPPPAPKIWVAPTVNGVNIRFNGKESELVRDVFSNFFDFEGYRVYIGRDNRDASFSLFASYDRKNFDKMVFNKAVITGNAWETVDRPMSVEEIRCLYGSGETPCSDPDFDPLRYKPGDPFVHPLFPDSLFYWQAHDYNVSELGSSSVIKRRFPDQPPPSSLVNPMPDELTDDGYLKYYEYEVQIDNLLPTVQYWVAVTAYDFGSPNSSLAPLESAKTLAMASTFPETHETVVNGNTEVYVYPNPYRFDGNYREDGYEGRGEADRPDDRVRAIHFRNLPAKCKIRIYSLDGDLIREIDHNFSPEDPLHTHDRWDLITRNTQAVVSGIYYWSVEGADGQVQIGKMVIIM